MIKPESKIEDLTKQQEMMHDVFTRFLVEVTGLRTPKHQTESLERRAQIFIRQCVDPNFTCVYDCKDVVFLNRCIEAISRQTEWSEYNKRHAGTIRMSMVHYVEFLCSGYKPRVIEKSPDGYSEGKEYYSHAVGYERNSDARKLCIEHYGYKCAVCGFDFEETYGEAGRGYIEVHHIVPVSMRGGSYLVDPIRDLRPLCSNCHSIIHKGNPVFSIEELRKMVRK